MKKLANYIVSFLKEDFNPLTYGIAFLFLIIAISYNYSVDFEYKVLDSYYRKPPLGMLYYFLFYASVYYLTTFQKAYFGNARHILSDKKFWIRSLFFMALLGVAIGFSLIEKFAHSYQGYEFYYISKLSGNLRFVIVFIIPLLIFRKLFDKSLESPYGFTMKNFNAKPYFIILLLIVPLVVLASFQPDFLHIYPKFKSWYVHSDVFGMTKLQMTSIYEITYASNFVMIEWFFRGALVIGMVAVMGRHAVLPMAVTYCTIHFGKPMAECISSFFGGYLLGIIAMYTRSIFGGCIVHVGTAMLMETAAMLQHYLFMRK